LLQPSGNEPIGVHRLDLGSVPPAAAEADLELLFLIREWLKMRLPAIHVEASIVENAKLQFV